MDIFAIVLKLDRIISDIFSGKLPEKAELPELLLRLSEDGQLLESFSERARNVSKRVFGNRVFLRGLIEIGNVCRNDCYYCGIRKSNKNLRRYVLSEDEILSCCSYGYGEGFRTFVLQGGENPAIGDDFLCGIIRKIKKDLPGSAITLSLGERGMDSFRKLRQAGADRYLLRHESADEEYFYRLHPHPRVEAGNLMDDAAVTNYARRMASLKMLKALGYQTGAGFMVGAPGQTLEHIAADLEFIAGFRPQMVGIGPYMPHPDTPLGRISDGFWTSRRKRMMTLGLLSILRMMDPCMLLPSTTALNTLVPGGHYEGILAGANVIMPNLSPLYARKAYDLYSGKVADGGESRSGLNDLKMKLEAIGYAIDWSRGDYIKI